MNRAPDPQSGRLNAAIRIRIFGTPNFGRIFSAKDPREMQFGLKLGW